MNITTIFFDFDGVLTPDSTGTFTTAYQLHLQHPEISQESILEAYRKYRPDLNSGKIRTADMWDDFCVTVAKEISLEDLKKTFLATPKNAPMLEVARDLKAAGYQVGIITNNDKDRCEALSADWGLDALFDPIVLSADVKALKPGSEIFQIALEKVGKRAEECVFVDNQKKNLVEPAKMGFKTCFYDHEILDTEAFVAQLQKWGIKF